MCGTIGSTPFAPAQGGCGGGLPVSGSPAQVAQAGAPGHQAHGGAGGAVAGAQNIGQTDQHASHGKNRRHGNHRMLVTQRTAPPDEARARRTLKAAMDMFSDARYEQMLPGRNPESNHRRIPEKLLAEWKRRYPDMPVPRAVVFDLDSRKPIGVVFRSDDRIDLGMGPQHQHNAGADYMQHIWFVPNDLELAYSDTTRGRDAKKAALAGSGGAPGKS